MRLEGRIMMLPTPQLPTGFEEELFKTVQTSPPPPPARPPFDERADAMFHYLGKEYAGEDAASNEPNLGLGRNDLESFFPELAEDARVHPVISSRRRESIGTLVPFSHEVGIDLQRKQVLSDDDTLSLFPEIKMDGAHANTSSTMDGVEDYMSVSSFGLDNLKESSEGPLLRHEEHHDIVNNDFSRMLCGNNLLSALPKTTFQEHHRMMAGDCERRRLEEIFNTQLRDVVRTCPQPVQPQLGGGNAVNFMSSSTPTSEEHFFSSAFVPFLPTHAGLQQNVRSFLPDLTLLLPEEVKLSPHPVRKLETVGGKKIFTCQYESRSGYEKALEEDKIKDIGNSSPENIARSCESPAFPKTTRYGNFREYLGPASFATRNVGQHVYVQNLGPDLQARTGSITYGSDTDYLLGDAHGYSAEHLQNKSTSGYFGPMQIMENGHMHELSLFDPVSTVSSTTRDQNIPVGKSLSTCSATDDHDSALNGLKDVLMASFSEATDTQSLRIRSSIYMENHMLERSKSFEFLDKDGFVSSSTIGDGIHVPITAKRSALTVQSMKPGCTPPQDSSSLTNAHKEKRWIYKQARLRKNPQFSQVSSKKKRASRGSEGPVTRTKPDSTGEKRDASRRTIMRPVCSCGQQPDPGLN